MILEKIRQLYPQLTKSQKRLADFIAASYQEAAFMTASRLARKLAINEATVIRFAQRLGYPGYPELIQDIQGIVQEELKSKPEVPALSDDANRFLNMLDNEVENLQRAISHISPELAHEALVVLRQARVVYVVGQGISAPLAELFSLSLRSLGLASESPPADPLSLAIMLDGLDEQGVVVGISADAESVETASALNYAKQRGARTLALTWSPISSAAQVADVAISCPANDLFALPSIGVIAILIDALIQSLGAENLEQVRARTERLAEAREFILNRRRR